MSKDEDNGSATNPDPSEPTMRVKLVRWSGNMDLPGKANRTGQCRESDGYEIVYLPRLRHVRVKFNGPLQEGVNPERMIPIERVQNWERWTPALTAKK